MKFALEFQMLARSFLFTFLIAFACAPNSASGKNFTQACTQLLSTVRNYLSQNDSRAEAEELRKALATPPYLHKRKLQTELYFRPPIQPDTYVPEVETDTKGIVIALGGAGGHGNASAFMRNSSSLAKFGLSLVAFDYPFHGLGPKTDEFNETNVFMRHIFSIIEYFKQKNVPVVLLGHSFGCTLAQEILNRKPDMVAAVFAISPGGNMNPEMLQHYRNFRYSSRWQEFTQAESYDVNIEGELWEEGDDGTGGVSGAFLSTKDNLKIETSVPFHIIAGNKDPWSSAEILDRIAKRFSNGTLEMIPGAGHHSIFRIRDGKESLLTSRLVGFFRDTLHLELPRLKDKVDPRARLQFLHQQSRLFRRWVARQKIHLPRSVSSLDSANALLELWNTHIASFVRESLLKTYTKEIRDFLKEAVVKEENFPASRSNLVFLDVLIPHRVMLDGRRPKSFAELKPLAAELVKVVNLLEKPENTLTSADHQVLMNALSQGRLERSTEYKNGGGGFTGSMDVIDTYHLWSNPDLTPDGA